MKIACVILAAGLGKRMNSPIPKVLHQICGTPMLQSVIEAVRKVKPEKIIVVAGNTIGMIRDALKSSDILYAHQKIAKGTGHALSCALPALKAFRGVVLVVNGDTPLVNADTLKRFLKLHHRNRNAVSVLSFHSESPENYGRIIRDKTGNASSIIEEKDADSVQKKINEVNSGVYAINHNALGLLSKIGLNPAKGEYYLTDIMAVASAQGLRTDAYCIGREEDFLGVNTREEFVRASRIMRQMIVSQWIKKGVNILDMASVFIHRDASIGKDSTIYPNVHIEGSTKIGKSVTIYPNVRILDSVIGDSVIIKDSTVIENSRIRHGASVGPFTHVRPLSVIGRGAKIGNFVELKKAEIGKASKASHLSYLGDTKIGDGVNIGAGTITCNYDGKEKHVTVIHDGVFIGSDTQLIAPVTVGKDAYIGAGSTITKDVPPQALAVSRAEQKTIEGWAKRKSRSANRKSKPQRKKGS